MCKKMAQLLAKLTQRHEPEASIHFSLARACTTLSLGVYSKYSI